MTSLTPITDKHDLLLRIGEQQLELTKARHELAYNNYYAAANLLDDVASELRELAQMLRRGEVAQ